MYPKAIFVALLSLSLSVSAIPAKNTKNTSSKSVASAAAVESCAAAAVKTVTVTQTAAAAARTLAANRGGKAGTTKTGTTGTAKTGTTGTAKTGTKGSNNAGTGNAAAAAAGNPQTSLTLSTTNVFSAFASDGGANATAGQEPSITSTNNFINFCLSFPGAQKTNGQQVLEGSCNQTPMGLIAAQSKMPSSKFVFPANGATIAANTDFTIQMAINNMETGHFTNPATTFHMAPQVVNSAGLIKGHSHVVIEKLSSLAQTQPTDPTKFVFFKGLNDVAKGGILTSAVAGGLPAGTYRLASINSAANHQPALVAVAQRGSLDDMVYFTVSANGKAANNAAAGQTGAATTSAATGKTTTAATGKTGTGRTKGAGKNRGRF